MKTVICTTLARLPPARFRTWSICENTCFTCASKLLAMSLPSLSRVAVCPATQTILPPSVMTPGENARESWNGVFSMYSAAVAAIGSETPAASASLVSMRVIASSGTNRVDGCVCRRRGRAGGSNASANYSRRQAASGARRILDGPAVAYNARLAKQNAMIRLSQVTLRRGTKTLLEGADVALNPGDKIGLIGANGSGKSSLFALLRGELHADKGEVDYPARWRVAYVAQETPALERTALDYAIDGDTTLRRLERELAAAEAVDDGHLIGELHAAMGDADAYTVRSRAEQLLHGLGFTHEQMGEPVASFSGGWRMRLNLAQALMCPSDLLLLDEPTNHLDLDAILWLEEWLKRYTGTLLIVSHDRDFLDGVVEVVVHIDAKKLRRYSGNYSSFERQRAAAVVLAASQYEKQERERAHLESFISRFRAKATKARQAQSRMKMLA